jgi:predicted enzyme related to lactoylglutathione lyase
MDPLLRKVDCVSETDFLVDSAEAAVRRVEELGGSVLSGPEDIPVGRVAKVADPFGNPLVLLDRSKGTFQTGPLRHRHRVG